MAKQLIQVIIAGSQVLGKAFANAVKQEIREEGTNYDCARSHAA